MNNNLDFGADQETEDLQLRGREAMQLSERVLKYTFNDADYSTENVEQETPSKILEREYMIFTSPVSLVTNSIKPYELLLDMPQFQRALYGFKFFKAGIKIRVLINSTPMYYGMLAVSWLPDTAAPPMQTLVETLNADPMVMDISAKDVLEFELPYISLYDAIKVDNVFDATSTPTVYFETLGYAQADSSMPMITYNVYASFTKPKAWGAQSAIISQSGKFLEMDMVRDSLGELTPNNREMVPYKSDNTLTTTTKALDITSSVVGAIPIVGPIISAIVDTAKMGVLAYDMASDAYERYQGHHRTKEQSLEDPIRQNPTAVRNQAYGDMASTVYSSPMQLTSNVPAFFPPFHKGDENMTHQISQALRIPTIRKVHSLTGSPPVIQLLYEPLSSLLTNDRLSYMDQIAPLFRYWRGSIKVSLFFYTSPLISATYRLLLFNADGGLDPPAPDPSTYAFKKVITVRGSVRVDVVIPYLSVVPWQPLEAYAGSYPAMSPPLSVSRLYLDTVTPPNTIGDQAPYVFVMTVVSAGDDFQMRDLRSPQPSWTEPPGPIPFGLVEKRKAESQMRVRADFDKCERENLAHGTNSFVKLKDLYEDTMTFEDASFRSSNRNFEAVNFQLRYPYSGENLIRTDTFDYIQNMFRYVRGSIRIKQSGEQPFYQAMMYGRLRPYSVFVPYVTALGNGGGRNTQAQNEVFEFEIPFQCQVEWLPTTMCFTGVSFTIEPNRAIVHITDTELSVMFVAAGQDYQLAFLLPPRKLFDSIPCFNT